MTEPWFRQRLVGHGLTLAPYDASRADEIDRIIYEELMLGKVNESSRRTMKTFLTDITKQDVQAVILACTELVMLVDTDANVLPIYDTTRILVAAGVDWVLGEETSLHSGSVCIDVIRESPSPCKPTGVSNCLATQGLQATTSPTPPPGA